MGKKRLGDWGGRKDHQGDHATSLAVYFIHPSGSLGLIIVAEWRQHAHSTELAEGIRLEGQQPSCKK